MKQPCDKCLKEIEFNDESSISLRAEKKKPGKELQVDIRFLIDKPMCKDCLKKEVVGLLKIIEFK